MSRPLWPEDMETLCPSVPLHMRHALAIYCNILLHIAICPQPVGVLRIHSLSACCLWVLPTCCLAFSVVSLLLFVSLDNLFLCMALLFPYHSFFSSLLIFLTTQQLQTWRYPAPYQHDAWPPASPLHLPPLRHDVTFAAAALRLVSCLLMVKDNTFHTVSAYVTFMFPSWQLQTNSLGIHLVFLGMVWSKTLGPDLCLRPLSFDDLP